MSFLFGGQPKMSSEQKIAAAETEVEMISDMFNRCALASTYLLAA
jgi:import inner membrane translocase subunit TIM10